MIVSPEESKYIMEPYDQKITPLIDKAKLLIKDKQFYESLGMYKQALEIAEESFSEALFDLGAEKCEEFGITDNFFLFLDYFKSQISDIISFLEKSLKTPEKITYELEEKYLYYFKKFFNEIKDEILKGGLNKVIKDFRDNENFIKNCRELAESIVNEILRQKNFDSDLIKNKNLNDKLFFLKDKGILPPEILDALFHLKNRGNIQSHPDLKEADYRKNVNIIPRKEICACYMFMVLNWFVERKR